MVFLANIRESKHNSRKIITISHIRRLCLYTRLSLSRDQLIKVLPVLSGGGGGLILNLLKVNYCHNYSNTQSPDTCAPDWASTRDNLIISSFVFSLLIIGVDGIMAIIITSFLKVDMYFTKVLHLSLLFVSS